MDMPTDKAAEVLLEMLKKVNNNDEIFELRAMSKKKMFDALVKVGFTDAQALTIAAGMGATPA